MGRDILFNTGVEYRFGFGIQSSEDIQEFGGYGIGLTDWNWDESDKEFCQSVLRSLQENYNLLEININEFEFTHKGTNALYDYLYEKSIVKNPNNAIYYLYMLGYLIYHQLHYMPNLTADYDP